VPFQSVWEALEQQVGDPGRDDLLSRASIVVLGPIAGQHRLLAVGYDRAAGLIDIGALAHHSHQLSDLRLATPGHQNHFNVSSVAGLKRKRLRAREPTFGIPKQ